ncbi:hypothetical protein [Nostoc sp. CHAB 5715]|uniref:hypothetical protein n=1 Tax=Nostoc sp. CHAB 5715 TaxID=2780400 RepID=UPI001E4B5B33|nr:hypothetical protein [Nostoc sp. CHAB 5715]MCC5620098.1 hypothetical protein [Nostoc sp. CHAB 5715]
MQSTDVRETIADINRNSGISNNMMAYRLALMMEKVPQSTVQSPIELDSQSRQNLKDKLRNILTKSTQNIEDYRQQLKNEYLAEYSQKFGVTQSETPVTEQPNNFSRVENLITQRKHIFLQSMIAQGSKANLTPSTPPNQEFNKQHQSDEFSKKSLMTAVVQTIIAKGQDTKNEGRVYEGVLYRLQLLIKEGIQFINVNRKNESNQKAFAAYKDHTNEFTITSNNLSNEEAQKIVAFNQQRIAKEQSQLSHIQTDKTQQFTFDKDDHSELGD